ncbi:MAG TPA: DUF2304 domain-containing protein [Intrasporangium sp.]|uniref:DUF2304 domain-containing protein n=1 Tax=Intrasporangium sp. TaxID=1925024 RepID=UPI002D784AF2|nr:DUF2304 domain-containing protein [Intrasporangium sp.]HET7399931.1 DUF2304 domain-containing protein [Intrasporangium sp.]
MRQLIIQVLLILGTLGIAWRLLLGYGQKAQALRRLGLLAFAAFAVFSVLFPNVWTRLANLVGIGRGADLILYGLVVAFFSFVVTTFKRFRDMETRYTRLARRVAIDETLPPTQHPAVIGPAPAPADQETLRDTPRESSRETLREASRETLRGAPLETPVPQAPAALESELPRDAS